MRTCRIFLLAVLLATGATLAGGAAEDNGAAAGNQEGAALPEEYSCMFCHGELGTLAGAEETEHLIVTEAHLVADVHWQKGLRCHDCHGGNPVLEEYVDHRNDSTFRPIESPAEIPGFCGHCHSDTAYMRRYRPSPRTDQEMEYWTSGHGQRLKEAAEQHKQALEKLDPSAEPPAMTNPGVATCIECHSPKTKHMILAVDDPKSPVYPTHVAETCARCHANPKLMDGLTYHGRPLGHDQYELWKESVHGQALLKKGDLSAPTCNDCHGNHGALPPEVDSVANACGTCHVKVATLFSGTQMKHRFEQLELPGCATCHGNHQTASPSDEMLGMGPNAVCLDCHKGNRFGATLTGAKTAGTMRLSLDNLKQQIAEAEQAVAEAERLGMEVSGPRYDLRQAHDALVNARSVIHTFALEPVEEVITQGLGVTSEVKASAEAALAEHTRRRVWLAASLVPILVVVVLLLLYIRALPVNTGPLKAVGDHS